MLRRNIWILSATASAWTFSNSLWVYQIPILLSSLGATALAIGLVYSVGQGVYAAINYVSGEVADRIGRKLTLVLSGLLRIASTTMFFAGLYVTSLWIFSAAYISYNVSAGLYFPVRDIVVTESSSERFSTRSISPFYAVQSAAAILGPAAGGFIIAFLSSQALFVVAAFIVAGVSLSWQLYLRETRRTVGPSNATPEQLGTLGKLRKIVERESLVRFIIYSSLIATLASSLISFLIPLFSNQRVGLSEVEVGEMYSVYFAVAAVITIPMGHLADKIGVTITRVALMGLRAATLVAVILAHTSAITVSVFFVAWLALGDSGQPVLNMWMKEFSTDETRATLFASLNALSSLVGVGSILIGSVLYSLSPLFLIGMASIITILSAVVASRLISAEGHLKHKGGEDIASV